MRLPIKQLVHAAHQAARYLPKASAQLMRDLAERLDTTQAALCESLKIRDALATENLALKDTLKNGVVEKHHQTSHGITIGVKNVIVQHEIDTPATDAWVNEQRAMGVELFAAHLRTNDNERSPAKLLALGAEEFAAQLRGSQV